MAEDLESEVIAYVGRSAFPEVVVEWFGRYREADVKAAITRAVERGALVETWFDDRALGGIRYSMLSSPEAITCQSG